MCAGLCRAGKWLNHHFIEQTIDKNGLVVTARDWATSLRTFKLEIQQWPGNLVSIVIRVLQAMA